MTRKIVTDALAEAAAASGYCFHTGFDYRIPSSIVAYPALWLCPPRIVAVEGRREGRVRYRVELQLMRLVDKRRNAEPETDPWEQLEADTLGIHRLLGDNRRIVSAVLTECAPAEFSLTNHGERSMGVKMDIEVAFCNL